MSWRASAYIKELQECPSGVLISRSEKLVGLILADSHQDKVGAYTFPSVQTIAADARMDERTCRRILASLEQKGVIRRMRTDHQGRGQVTFYRFPELDQAPDAPAKANGKGGHDARLSDVEASRKGGQNARLSDVEASRKGGQNARLFSNQRGAKGGQKEDKTGAGTIGRTGTGTQEQKQSYPPDPPTGAGGRSVGSLFDDQANGNAAGNTAIEPAIDQVMSGCAWTKRRLREKLRAVLELEFSKGAAPATTALAIMAAWKFQSDRSHLLRGKFGPANFLELGIWKNANLLQWDHERMDRNQNGARL